MGSADAIPARGLRVLITTEDPRLQHTLGHLVASSPRLHLIGVCATARSAIASLKADRPAVLVLDWSLNAAGTALDVFSAARKVCPGCKVVALSTGESVRGEGTGGAGGADYYLSKSADPRYLATLLEALTL